MPAFAPRAAPGEAIQSEIGAAQRAMALQRFDRIDRAGRREAAAGAQPRAQEKAIALDQADERGTVHCATRAKSSCSSVRTARFRTSELALTNCLRSKPERSRTTWAAAGSFDSNSRDTA